MSHYTKFGLTPYEAMKVEENGREQDGKNIERVSTFFGNSDRGRALLKSFAEFSRTRHIDRMRYDAEPFGEDANKYNKTDAHEEWVQRQILRDRSTPPVLLKPTGMVRSVRSIMKDIFLQQKDAEGPGGVDNDGFKEIL